MGDLEDRFRADTQKFDEQYQRVKARIEQTDPELAHVLFNTPICAEHEVPVDQCNCP